MTTAAKTLATMLVLAGLLVVAALWGLSAATQPFPGKADAAVCVDRTVGEGEKVFTSDVTVSVDNAGTRNGLAGRTLLLFHDAGFGEGTTGNASRSAEVRFAQIWTNQPDSPAVALVKAWLGRGARIVDHRESRPGVLVLVGDGFQQLTQGPRKVVASSAVTICSPPID